MKLIESAVKHPVTVTVGVILVVMFGTLALLAVPVQLTPDVDRPTITVSTTWRGASPQEVERDIVEVQEKYLKGLEGLVRMTSESVYGRGRVILEFEVGADMDASLLLVNNRLQQVPRYPAAADKPVIISASENARPIAWMVIIANGPKAPVIDTMRTYVIERVAPLIERVGGVAQSNVYGGRDQQMQVVVDPRKVAAHRLTMSQVARAITNANTDVSAGGVDEGKRRYAVRTVSRITKPADADRLVVAYHDGAPVKISDLGKTRIGYARAEAVVLYFGQPNITMNAIRETGTNVMEVMAGLKQAIAEINRNVLAPLDLVLKLVYDETEYIVQAIDLVTNNIFIGGSLAVIVLLLFLRSIPTTGIIMVAIPISLVGTFIMMAAFGRNLNVISLAGLAFAVGMVVDSSIVVLENIFRRRQAGEDRFTASVQGTKQVWGAILASTLTTVAVFLPVLRIKQEAGQLFADIAIAVSFAVLISLMVSITVIPTLAARLVGGGRADDEGPAWRGKFKRLGGLTAWAEKLRAWVADAVFALTKSVLARLAVVLGLVALSLGSAWLLAPKAEYLPTGNRNLILGILLPPPGYNNEEIKKVGMHLADQWRGYWGTNPPEPEGAKQQPSLQTFFYVGWEGQIFMGLSSHDPYRVRELIPIMQRGLATVPGMIPIVQQTSLFARGANQGRTIDLDLSGPDLTQLVTLGQGIFGKIMGLLPGSQVRPIPGLDLSQPELRFIPDRVRAAAVGMNARDIGLNLDVLAEGSKIDEVNQGGYSIDLVLMANNLDQARTQDLGLMEVNTPGGRLVTLESLAPPALIGGPVQINHIERQRALTLRIYPPEAIALQEAMEKLRAEVVEPMKASGQVKRPYDIRLSGTADDLTRTAEALSGNFLLALAITFLLMSALFESFIYPFVIMFSVPMAAAGGFLGLWLVNKLITHQSLDVLTMLGFVILVGIVVNNAILIVDQSIRGIRQDNLEPPEAIRLAVYMRVRPIFMSTLTSVIAMLPLVLFPGPGSELYRGLGSVVTGGLLVSTVFTLFMVPALLSLVLDARRALSRRLGRQFKV